jgi:hypothetical protein
LRDTVFELDVWDWHTEFDLDERAVQARGAQLTPGSSSGSAEAVTAARLIFIRVLMDMVKETRATPEWESRVSLWTTRHTRTARAHWHRQKRNWRATARDCHVVFCLFNQNPPPLAIPHLKSLSQTMPFNDGSASMWHLDVVDCLHSIIPFHDNEQVQRRSVERPVTTKR